MIELVLEESGVDYSFGEDRDLLSSHDPDVEPDWLTQLPAN